MSDVIQSDRIAYAGLVEGDSDNPLRVAKANEIYAGNCDDEVITDLRAKLDVAREALRAIASKGRSPGIGVTRDIADAALATIGDGDAENN